MKAGKSLKSESATIEVWSYHRVVLLSFGLALCYVGVKLAVLLWNTRELRDGNQTLALYKILEDDDFYLGFFHRTAMGQFLMRGFWPLLGIHYSGALTLAFELGALALAAALLFCFLQQLQQPERDPVAAGPLFLSAVAWSFLNRQLLNLVTALSPEGLGRLARPIEFLRSILGFHGNLFGRFYEPALGLLLFVGILVLRGARSRGKIHLAAASLLALSSGRSPWIASTLCVFLLGECCLQLWQRKPLSRFDLFLLPVASISLAWQAWDPGRHPDFLSRLEVYGFRNFDWSCTWPSALALLLGIVLRRRPEGRFIAKLGFANFVASLLPLLLLGKAVSPDHFLRVLTLVPALCLALLLHRIRLQRRSRGIVLLGAALFLLALSQLVGLRHSRYYLIPTHIAEKISRAGDACLKGAESFISRDTAFWWLLPATTPCRNYVPMGWEDSSLSNQEIALRFRAALEFHAQAAGIREVFPEILERALRATPDPRRELSRDLNRFTREERFELSAIWYAFHVGGYYRADAKEYFRELFRSISPRALEEEGRKLRLAQETGRVILVDAESGPR